MKNSSDRRASKDSEADPLDRLDRLADLYDEGKLTDEEFIEMKHKLIDDL